MGAAGIKSDSKRVSSVAPNPPAPITTYSTVATVWSVKPSTNGPMIRTIVAAMSATPCRTGGRIRMMLVDQFVPIASRVAAPPRTSINTVAGLVVEVNRERHRDQGCREEVVERPVYTRRDRPAAQKAEQILHECPFPI